MTKDFIIQDSFGTRKIFALPDGTHDWTKRQIVADFVAGPDGDFAFACFREGLARNGGSLRNLEGVYLVGSFAQLDNRS